MSNPNGYVWYISDSIQIDLQGGLVTMVPVFINSTPPGVITITLVNCAPGVLTQVMIWNGCGSSVTLKMAAVDLGENPVTFLVSNGGTPFNFSKQNATLPNGSIHTAVGALISNQGNNSFLMSLV